MEIYAKGIESRQLNEIIRSCKDDKIVIRGVNGQRLSPAVWTKRTSPPWER